MGGKVQGVSRSPSKPRAEAQGWGCEYQPKLNQSRGNSAGSQARATARGNTLTVCGLQRLGAGLRRQGR